jgi:pilus assembly protein CpaB
MTRPPRVAEAWRALSRHRVLLASGLAAGAVASSLGVLAPRAEAGVAVLAATRDLPAGTALAPGDLRAATVPPGVAPTGAVTGAADALGRVLAAPVRRGETLTDVRLAGAGLLGTGHAGLVAAPVRIADAASAALVTAGDRIDVLAASSAPGAAPAARVVASNAEVLAVPSSVRDGEGALIVVAALPETAARLASAAVSSRLSLTVRPRA